VLRSPSLLTRETLAGVLTALALIPEVISFSVIAGVDPKVSLIASVVLCLAMSVLGGRPAMVTAAAGSWRWSLARWCISTAYSTFCPPCCWRA
jgi:SulP family sulfate permease